MRGMQSLFSLKKGDTINQLAINNQSFQEVVVETVENNFLAFRENEHLRIFRLNEQTLLSWN